MPVIQEDKTLTLSLPNGSSATVYWYGATVVSWKAPDAGKAEPVKERLFVSGKAAMDGSKPIRGGIPIAFPFFGPPTKDEHRAMSQHGFARASVWALDAVVLDTDTGVSVRLSIEVLNPTPGISSVFPHPFSLAYVVTLSQHQLSTDIHVHNTSPASILTFQSLLHTYFLCDASKVTVSSLKGLTFVDKTKNYTESKEERDEVDVKSYTDAVYKDAGGSYNIWYEGSENLGAGGVHVKTKGFRDVVVWNPQAEAGRAIADMEEGGWAKYICVEPGMASYWHDLSPGEKWLGLQTLSAL